MKKFGVLLDSRGPYVPGKVELEMHPGRIPYTTFTGCGVVMVFSHGECGPPMDFPERKYKMTLELVEKEEVKFAKHFDRIYRSKE